MMDDLKALVEILVVLNDDNLAQTVIDNNDVQWCLSELRDILNTDMVRAVRCKNCKFCGKYLSGTLYCKNEKGLLAPKPNDFCSYGNRKTSDA